jgi:hypothetical protein
MKYYNLKHSTTIYVNQIPESSSAKEGQLESHLQKVSSIEFYESNKFDNSESYIKVCIDRDMILEIADQIRKIESEVVVKKYDNLPFYCNPNPK